MYNHSFAIFWSYSLYGHYMATISTVVLMSFLCTCAALQVGDAMYDVPQMLDAVGREVDDGVDNVHHPPCDDLHSDPVVVAFSELL